MSPQAAELLVQEIAPRLRSSLSKAPQIGADDLGEMVQDGLALAATLLASAEARGKAVSAGNISYYAARLVKQGRRSTGQSTTDVLSPGTQLAGRSRLVSLDAALTEEVPGEEPMCLHDVLASTTEDPATAAIRRLDWARLVSALDTTARKILHCLSEGQDLTSLVPKLKRSRSALQGDKERLARQTTELFGSDILAEVQHLPQWHDNLVASRERSACRYARALT